MSQSLATLEKGYCFEPAGFNLSDEWVQDYINAVEDQAIVGMGAYAPPMSLAALAIRALLQQSRLPAGSIHAAQEISFLRPVTIGERLYARAEVLSRGERQGWVLMSVGLHVVDAAETVVMDGRAMITFPVGAAVAA
jgi:acyl dehydratase